MAMNATPETEPQPNPEDSEQRRQWTELARQRAADPRGYFARLRAQCPVDFDECGDNQAQVLRRADIEYVLRTPAEFSSDIVSQTDIMGSTEAVIPLNVDPPLHSDYRRLLDPLFSPRRMAALEPAVVAHANRIIDTFIDRGECDFSAELAVPLPCSTFLSLLGLPQSELLDLVRWKDIMIRPEVVAGSFTAGKQLQAETAVLIYQRFASAMAERREAPTEDLISFLLTAEIDGRVLSDSEILRTLFLLLAAGLDTVTISLECIFSFLVEHPEARRMLVEEPDSLEGLIEELLRWETPVQSVVRRATRDTELSGCPIAQDSLVLVSLSSGNGDPEVPGAESVDVRRGDKRHLSFGGGPHRCLGSHLARMELRAVIREWHRRIPEYELKAGVTVEWNGSSLRGIDYLPLTWKV